MTIELIDTPHGLLDPGDNEKLKELLNLGSTAILACEEHTTPKCKCWAHIREILYSYWNTGGVSTPAAWQAENVWNELERLEKQKAKDERRLYL